MTVTNYNIEDKDFLKYFKLYFSSLFARKQRFLYSYNNNPFTAIYSTLNIESLLIQRPTIEDTIHKVNSKDISFIESINVYLPLNKLNEAHGYCVNIFELQELIRFYKTKDEISKHLILSECGTFLYVKKERKIKKVPTILDFPVIYKISNIENDFFNDLIDSFKNDYKENKKNEWMSLNVDYINFVKSDINFLPVNIENYKSVNIPFLDGFNALSISEFGKKRNDTDIKLFIKIVGNILRYYYVYKDQTIEVLSIPIMGYFYLKKENK